MAGDPPTRRTKMSAPHQFALESQNIGYGFLASSLADLLRSRPHTELDEVSADRFRQGVEFLNDVVRGAEVVSLGKCGALTTERSIKALGYAMQPIVALQEAVTTNEDFVRIIREMSACLEKVSRDRSLLSRDENEERQLKIATTFFEALAERILSSLSTARTREAPDAL
jgi:hypothetical protein